MRAFPRAPRRTDILLTYLEPVLLTTTLVHQKPRAEKCNGNNPQADSEEDVPVVPLDAGDVRLYIALA